ncbi:FmdB family zinc ribbon protein [Thermodesulfobacteriota bacterium]
MPLFDYLCQDCGKASEVLITASNDQPQCRSCKSVNLKKMISAHSSLSGASATSFPGPGDSACCGSTPTNAGCAGPGNCCGKTMT